jgi:hypothetical protein
MARCKQEVEESTSAQLRLRSFLVCVTLLLLAIVLAKYNTTEFQRALTPEGPLPHEVLERFMLGWFLIVIASATVAFRTGNRIFKGVAIAFALGAAVAWSINMHYWVQVVSSI